MKVRYALLAVAALASQSFAGTPTIVAPAVDAAAGLKAPKLCSKNLSGSLTVGADTNYVGRGLVISHSVAEGDSSEFAALKLNYGLDKKKTWSIDSTLLYKAVSSGHTLYGPAPYNKINAARAAYEAAQEAANGLPAGSLEGVAGRIRRKNIENEFAVVTAGRYSQSWGSVTFGHKYVHGGLLGAMAKHFRQQSASSVNEVFVAPTFTPAKWLETGVTVSYSFQGIQGWWVEPYLTLKAPVFGEPQKDNSMVAMLTFGMSATINYFQSCHIACANGPQAWWIKLATPYFLTQNLIITPSVSFNWLGTGGQKANSVAELKNGLKDGTLVPFRNFAVVGGLSATYTF